MVEIAALDDFADKSFLGLFVQSRSIASSSSKINTPSNGV